MASRARAASSPASLALAALLVAASQAASARADDGPRARVYAKLDGERANPASAQTRTGADQVALSAFLGETASLQIVVDAEEGSLEDVTFEVAPLEDTKSPRVLRPTLYLEHFVPVVRRSSNEREPASSLGFTAAARPADVDLLGSLPDALIPLALARCDGAAKRTFCPYPLDVPKGSLGAAWIDLPVPEDLPAGHYASRVVVRSEGRPVGTIPLSVDVAAVRLPQRSVGFFAYYAFDSLRERFDDPARAERELWQTLHASGVDPATALVSQADLDRTFDGYAGRWFRGDAGYAGPGEGQRPEVAPVGAYGSLGEPTRERVALALSLGERLASAAVVDRFVYAVDEDCKSPLTRRWRESLHGHVEISVGQTCDEDPRRQDADVVMMPAQAFRQEPAREARRLGKKVFVYNGQLPYTGTLLLDAPLTSLTIDGWIAASRDVGRWFLWETIFWNDDNRGGRGPRDVLGDPETFHNADGDACLGDGLLLYPGKQPRFPEHSLGVEAVLPSMRLFALRRGIADAGLVALASSVDPNETLRIVNEAVPRALDEVDPDEPAPFELDPARLAVLRAELRALASRAKTSTALPTLEGAPLPADADARASLVKLRAHPGARPRPRASKRLEALVSVALPLGLFASAYLVVRALERRRTAR